MRRLAFFCLVLAAGPACDLSGLTDNIGDGGIPPVDPNQAEDILNLKICGDQTVREVFSSDTLSEECRERIEDLLPEAQGTAEDRLVVLGEEEADGQRLIYLSGFDGEGAAIDADAFAEAAVTAGGEAVEAGITRMNELDTDLLSLGVVNDYSGSMRSEDMAKVEEIHTALFEFLPPTFEAEVTYFSEEVTTKQAFTQDREALLAAVAQDEDYEQKSTALLDGTGVALESLTLRDRPVKVLLLSTDGGENASGTWTLAQIRELAEANRVVIIVLGAVLAKVDQLRDLAGDTGIFVYARGYGRLRQGVQELIRSFDGAVQISVPAGTEGLRVEVGGRSIEL